MRTHNFLVYTQLWFVNILHFVITCSNFLINELDLQIEDLLVYFTVRQLQFLSPAYHVAEISYLQRNNTRLSIKLKKIKITIWTEKNVSTTELYKFDEQYPLANISWLILNICNHEFKNKSRVFLITSLMSVLNTFCKAAECVFTYKHSKQTKF